MGFYGFFIIESIPFNLHFIEIKSKKSESKREHLFKFYRKDAR